MSSKISVQKRVSGTAIFLLSTTAFTAAHAQENAPNAALDDNVIIVTAQKIEQRATDVPITISAASGERMRELGVSDLDELSSYVPGLNIQEQSANNPGIVIRGITSDSGSSQQAARVTLYYNGVDISRSRGSYQGIYDMDRVEVIKGPQATLFGTASTVGAVSLISAKPKPGFSGEMYAGYGNYDQMLAGGHINLGNDIFSARIAGEFRKRDGYVQNLSPNQDDLYAQNQLGLRGSFRYTPSEDFTADLVLTYDRQRNSGTPFISGILPTEAGAPNPFGPAHLGGSPVSQAVFGRSDLGLVRDVYDANLTLEWQIADDWTLTMVNGYRKFDANEIFDADGSAAFFLEFQEEAIGEQGSHETRFSYSGDNFRGSFGWNLFRESSNQRTPLSTEEGVLATCLQTICIAPNGFVFADLATANLTGGFFTFLPYSLETENLGKNDSYSVFADGTWIASEKLEVTAGVRFLIEKRRSGYRGTVPATVLPGLTPVLQSFFSDTGGQTFRTEDSYSAILPRFNLLYRFNDNLNGFATISKGRRSATVNLDAAPSAMGPVPLVTNVPAETVWNYEIGLKGSSGPISGSIGIYYQIYDNFQVDIPDPNNAAQTIVASAGSASNFGVEAEVNVRAADWINIFGNISFIDGGIDDKPSIAPSFRGAPFRLQPKWQGAAGFTLDVPIAEDIRFFATPSITYRSRIFFETPSTILTFAGPTSLSQGPVALVNLKAGVAFADDKYEISGFARNITDKKYLLDAGNTGANVGYPTFIPAEPATYGVQLTARF